MNNLPIFTAGHEFNLQVFKKACDENEQVTYLVPMPDIQTVCDWGMDGLNESMLDDIFPNGYLLEDVSYETVVQDGKAYVQVSAHAGAFLAECEEE